VLSPYERIASKRSALVVVHLNWSSGISASHSHFHLPLPQPSGGCRRQPVTSLARHHNDLTTVMSFVRHEVSQHVPDVKREIAPDVAFRRWELAFCRQAQLEMSLDPGATAFQRGGELPRRDTTVIDARGSRNAVLPSERLDPTAP
jgi:hypothetical protein